MNKIALILCFFVIFFMGPPLFAEVHGNVEFGYDTDKQIEYADVNVEYHWKPLCFTHIIYGGVKTYFFMDNTTVTQILKGIFTIGTIVQYQDFYIQLNHFCSHPIINTPAWKQEIFESYFWDSSGTQISVGIKW